MLGLHVELNEHTHVARGGHPENTGRLRLILDWLNSPSNPHSFAPVTIKEYGLEPVLSVHSSRYIESLQLACERGVGHLDPDTYVVPTSLESALRTTNAALSAAEQVIDGTTNSVFLLMRPPGHHAEHDRAMGFCLINTIAVVAQSLVQRHGLQRVAIIDFDVHHGNGTQHIFYDRADVFFASSHHYPYYPGSGGAGETGVGPGRGYTLNIPLSPGSGDREVLAAFESTVIPRLREYKPQFILVSAGFDAHERDPIGGLRVTGNGFKRLGELIKNLAGDMCDGKVISLLEGGYDAQGNLDAISNYLSGLDTV